MKVLITGAGGFLGGHLRKALTARGAEVVSPSSAEVDLRKPDSLQRLNSHRFDYIYHLAAWTQAGDFCLHHPGEQWIINQQINTTVLSWWKEQQAQAKLIAMGSSCCYEPGTPHTEDRFMLGSPTESLFTYAMTKRMLYQGLRALHQQFGLRYLLLVPSTLYGPDYHLDGRQMHFIFDLMRKIVEGKYLGKPVTLWGNGYQGRELIHVSDFVSAALSLGETLDNEIVNIGGGTEHSIREFAGILAKLLNFPAERIEYDSSKYVGARSKVLDISKIKSLLPDFTPRPLELGLAETLQWYLAARKEELESTTESTEELSHTRSLIHLVRSQAPRGIHQFVSCFTQGDGVCHCIRNAQKVLRDWGFSSEIFVENTDQASRHECQWFEEHRRLSSERNFLFLHPNDGRSQILRYLPLIPDKKFLYYHNITPPEYFAPYDSISAEACSSALQALRGIAPIFAGAACVSEVNAADLRTLGYQPSAVLGIPLEVQHLERVVPDPATVERLADGRVNILFVGRLAPNKCQHDILSAFKCYQERYNPHSRLILSGSFQQENAYYQKLVREAAELGLSELEILGHISLEELLALYKGSHLFLSQSEHEGFCIPVLESMYFKLPVLAFDCSGVRETIANEQQLLSTKDPAEVAKAMHRILTNESERKAILAHQQKRLEYYREELYRERLAKFLEPHLRA